MKKQFLVGLYFSLLFFVFHSCTSKNKGQQAAVSHCVKEASLPIKYAKGFSVDYYNGFKVISVLEQKDSAKIIVQYVLFFTGKFTPVDFQNAIPITTPVRKTICVSTNDIAEMATLNLIDSIAGVANVNLIYNSEVLNKIKQNEITDIGTNELNYEKIVTLQPSFVFTSGNWDGGDKMKTKLSALRIKSVLNLDYMEQDPLARAEWIKFVAAFYDKENEADSIFSTIEKNYLVLKDKATSAKTQPTVFCNIPFKEIWYMPCGENYMTQLITDAGGNFLWNSAKATNELNLNLNYEAVYNKAAKADFWINTGFIKSLQELKESDKKNTLFSAYKTGNVFNNNKRNTSSGGFDFWESGAVNPDKVLADLIFIFHPELLPEHELFYYQKLK